MRFKNVFSIIGPAMIGPSSSHTAGAVRIGRMARQLLGRQPERVRIELFGSFAETYKGHGTDKALAAGLLDFDTDDSRVVSSLEEMEKLGIEVEFAIGKGTGPHPNSANIELWAGGSRAEVLGASIGGGNIVIHALNGFDVKCTGEFPTLVLIHHDSPGVLAAVTKLLSDCGINIGYMDVDRKERNGQAMTVVEADNTIPEEACEALRALPSIHSVTLIDLTRKVETP